MKRLDRHGKTETRERGWGKRDRERRIEAELGTGWGEMESGRVGDRKRQKDGETRGREMTERERERDDRERGRERDDRERERDDREREREREGQRCAGGTRGVRKERSPSHLASLAATPQGPTG